MYDTNVILYYLKTSKHVARKFTYANNEDLGIGI